MGQGPEEMNIRRKLDDPTGVSVDGYTLIYADYKEPLKKLLKHQGFGFAGTLAQTSDKEFVQCHICGNLFVALAGHIRKHKLSAKEYRERFGLMASTALCSDTRREALQKTVVTKLGNTELPSHLIEYNRKMQAGEIKHNPTPKGTWTLERRNKGGVCPEQVLERIKDLADILGKTPSSDEFRDYYRGRYWESILYLHGSWSNAIRKTKLISRNQLRHPDGDQLIATLQEFHKQYGRIPMTSDFARGLLRDKTVYIRVFGSLNNARIEAGLNAILPLPFGQIIEMTPEQYLDYKAGRGVSKDAVRARQLRARKRLERQPA